MRLHLHPLLALWSRVRRGVGERSRKNLLAPRDEAGPADQPHDWKVMNTYQYVDASGEPIEQLAREECWAGECPHQRFRRKGAARRRVVPPRDERGSTALFYVVIVFALFATIGLVVDGGGKIRALQQADSVAYEAARAGGQAVQGPEAVQGNGATIDAGKARSAAQSYLSAAGVRGSVDIVDGTRLRVTTTTHYEPIFLGLIGAGNTMTTHGTAEVRLVQGIGGQEIGQ